ncbi:uncharacterized protein LOC113351144 [Papaver somniferum]|uniref:uncharacterized protein LOC113351144 n=1 Tax=Papaver somniferum TaxID=3469 RepID=UPI000E705C23|nr:uncharacterized protein LOC113351144 [Papaver somniferum]
MNQTHSIIILDHQQHKPFRYIDWPPIDPLLSLSDQAIAGHQKTLPPIILRHSSQGSLANVALSQPINSVAEAVVVSSAPAGAKNEGVITSNGGGGGSHYKKNRIQVSNTKKPLFFYVNLAKRYMRQHSEVELSALGMAIATVVTISEILKNHGLAIEKKLVTSTVDMKDENKGRLVQKAKIEILLGKTENFDNLMAKAVSHNLEMLCSSITNIKRTYEISRPSCTVVLLLT